MATSPKNAGQGNNQSAGSELSSGAVVQPGEDAGALAAVQQQEHAGKAPGVADFLKNEQPVVETPPPRGIPQAREMSSSEMAEVLQNLQKQQAQMAQMLSALARNNPVLSRSDSDQFSEVPATTLDMPTDRPLDQMARPDRRIEGVDIDVIANMDHAQQLAFLEEYVVVNIADTAEQGAENPVVLHVNGRAVAIVRSEDTAVRRKYVELLLRAKPEAIQTRITRGGDGEPRNHIDKTRSLKYPFSIVLDRNPRGPAWARKIRSEA